MGGVSREDGQEAGARRPGLGARGLALIGLLVGIAGFAVAVLPAITGSGGFAGAYILLLSFVGLTIVGVIVIAVGAVLALLTKRLAGIALMLGSAMFLVGYEAGYFVVVYSLYYS
jgi:hypothetical protein